MAFPTQICNTISVRLDETNYPTWVFQMQHHLRGHGLLKFVDGSHPCPPQFLVTDDGSLKNNSVAREKWMEQDSSVISLIIITLSPDALTLVVGCLTSMEVWLTLKQRYASTSELHIMKLKSTLQSIQKGSDCIEKYLLKFKSARDQLASVGVTISDQDVNGLILAGLPIEYGPTRQIIRGKNDIGMEEVRSLLLSAEYEIELKYKALSVSPLTAMIAHNGWVNQSPQNFQIMNTVAQNQTLYPYVNGCPVPSSLLPSMNGMSHSSAELPNVATMNNFNATSTAATPRFGVVPPSNMTTSTGFSTPKHTSYQPAYSNGASFGTGYGIIPTPNAPYTVNNGYYPEPSPYNHFSASVGFLANNNSGPTSRGFPQNGNGGYSGNNGYSQNNASNVTNSADIVFSSSTDQGKGREKHSVSDDLTLNHVCCSDEKDTLSLELCMSVEDSLITVGMVEQNQVKVDGVRPSAPVDSSSKPMDMKVGVKVQNSSQVKNGHLTSHFGEGTALCPSPQNSLFSAAPTLYCEAKQSFINTKVSEYTSSIDKSVETSEVTNFCDVTDESSFRCLSNNMYKPYKANDGSWEAIQAVRDHDGMLGLNNFKLLNSKHNTQGVGLSHLKNKKVDLSATKSISSSSREGSEEKENSDLNTDAAENKAFIPPYSIPSKWQQAILKEIDTLLIQGTWQLPCTSLERPLLNCRQACQPMKLWQLPLIPPG